MITPDPSSKTVVHIQCKMPIANAPQERRPEQAHTYGQRSNPVLRSSPGFGLVSYVSRSFRKCSSDRLLLPKGCTAEGLDYSEE